jgi:hypothetical protein
MTVVCVSNAAEFSAAALWVPRVSLIHPLQVYVCGEAHSVPVPPSASEVAVDESCVTNLVTLAHSLSGNLQSEWMEPCSGQVASYRG